MWDASVYAPSFSVAAGQQSKSGRLQKKHRQAGHVLLTWHVVMHKVESRAAAYFVAHKSSTRADEARVMGHAPPQLHRLLPAGQQGLRGACLQGRGLVMCKKGACRLAQMVLLGIVGIATP